MNIKSSIDTHFSISEIYLVKNLPRFLRSLGHLPPKSRLALTSFSRTSLVSSPMYMPEIIFSNNCFVGLMEFSSMARSNSVITKSSTSPSPNAPHSVLISMFGLCSSQLPGIAHCTLFVFSTQQALLPVPRIRKKREIKIVCFCYNSLSIML